MPVSFGPLGAGLAVSAAPLLLLLLLLEPVVPELELLEPLSSPPQAAIAKAPAHALKGQSV